MFPSSRDPRHIHTSGVSPLDAATSDTLHLAKSSELQKSFLFLGSELIKVLVFFYIRMWSFGILLLQNFDVVHFWNHRLKGEFVRPPTALALRPKSLWEPRWKPPRPTISCGNPLRSKAEVHNQFLKHRYTKNSKHNMNKQLIDVMNGCPTISVQMVKKCVLDFFWLLKAIKPCPHRQKEKTLSASTMVTQSRMVWRTFEQTWEQWNNLLTVLSDISQFWARWFYSEPQAESVCSELHAASTLYLATMSSSNRSCSYSQLSILYVFIWYLECLGMFFLFHWPSFPTCQAWTNTSKKWEEENHSAVHLGKKWRHFFNAPAALAKRMLGFVLGQQPWENGNASAVLGHQAPVWRTKWRPWGPKSGPRPTSVNSTGPGWWQVRGLRWVCVKKHVLNQHPLQFTMFTGVTTSAVALAIWARCAIAR